MDATTNLAGPGLSSAETSPRKKNVGWSWGQRSLTRIHELQVLCTAVRIQAVQDPVAMKLADGAHKSLANAKEVIERKWPPWGRLGAHIDTVETNLHAAACLLLRAMPLEMMAGRLPDIVATIQEHLPTSDPRRREAEEIARGLKEKKFLRHLQPGTKLDETLREALVTALRAAYDLKEREYLRVRSFRNIVYGVTLCLTLLAIALGAIMAWHPTLVPICFTSSDTTACPTRIEDMKRQPDSSPVDPDASIHRLVTGWDYVLIELVGLIAAAVAAAAALREIRGTSVPFSVPLALALLKLPTGALTAVLGLLLMRGQFIPGLSALDSPAQIIAWAVVFGYAQQLLTHLVDERGQRILNDVGGAENPKGENTTFETPGRPTARPQKTPA